MHVIINGVSSETLQGVQVLSLPPITKPRMRTSVAVIDGRPGDIVTRLGYEAYNRKIQILLHHDYDIDAISAFFNTSGTIIFSNEPDMEYEFETIDAFSFERAVRYKTADITFHVQPYKLSATEEPATGEVSTLVDKTPYIIRRTPFGTRQKGTIVGGSVVWNQLLDVTTMATKTSQGITYTNNGDGSITLTGTPTSNNGFENINYVAGVNPYILDHVYLLFSGYTGELQIGVRIYGIESNYQHTYTEGYTLRKATELGANGYVRFQITNLQDTDIGTVKLTPQLFDLTLMFGPTIADYIYSKEQAHAGDGVALAKAWAGITAGYYPYDAGTIKSVEGLTSHKTTGYNQWDEEWEVGTISSLTGENVQTTNRIRSKNYIPVIGGETYYLQSSLTSNDIRFFGYDGSKSFVEAPAFQRNGEFTVPSTWRYMRFITAGYGTTYKNDICINLSDPSKNGQYEPYTAHEYPLDSSLTLRGLPKLDGDSIYYDGDIYPPSGEATRKYGVVDLGTLMWTKNSSYNLMQASLNDARQGSSGNIPNIVCALYPTAVSGTNADIDAHADKTITVRNASTVIVVKDTSYTDATSFKTAMSGVYLVYELAEPTTETAEPYTALQICDPAGTEEFVGASMPVGHETTYIDPISMTVNNTGNTTSAPSITIEGEGAVEVTVDGLNILQIQMPASGEITVDSKTLDATDGEGGLANRSVTGDYNDLQLAPGEHTVTVTGDVTSVTLKNISRWI